MTKEEMAMLAEIHAMLARQSKVIDQVEEIVEKVTPLLADLPTILDQVSKSPVLKMLGVRL